MKNPFNAQGPTAPRYYANRAKLLGSFKQSVIGVAKSKGITKPLNIAIMGRWGIGKTSTLYKFKDMLAKDCEGAKAFSVVIPLKPACCSDADTFSATILEALLNQYKATAKLDRKIRDFADEELDLLGKWRIAKLSLNPEFERKERGIRALDFSGSLVRLWKKLQGGHFDIAVIMIDDIQYVLNQGRGDLLFDLRTDMQTLAAEDTRFMFVITGPASLYPDIRNAAEPFTRLFEKFDLDAFDFEGTKEMIKKPLKTENIRLGISDEVIRKIHEITEGHPYFVTLVMRDMLDKNPSGEIGAREFAGLYPDLTEHFARVRFDDDFTKATDAEKQILLKMAKSDKEEISPSDIKGSPKLLERLVKKDMVIKLSRGKYKLYHKLFKNYLRKK